MQREKLILIMHRRAFTAVVIVPGMGGGGIAEKMRNGIWNIEINVSK